jgi:hypothetical protein
MTALVLADAVAEKFGGDSVGEASRNVASYLDSIDFAPTALPSAAEPGAAGR